MIDREKVVNGLREMSCRATWKDIDRIRHKFQPIINDAIALLKEQEPVMPKLVGVNTWVCGECDTLLGWEDFTQSGLELVNYKYCPGCGRKVKWDAETSS